MDTLTVAPVLNQTEGNGHAPPTIPLCVDLDGTLVRTDTLWETTIAQLKCRPWKMLLLPFWLWQGKARLKQRLAEGISLDCPSLPYNEELLDYLRQARAAGRELVLVSACDRSVGTQISEHLGLFSEVITSDGKTNLKGPAKARLLKERFGSQGFDYAGNEKADFPIWEAARERLAVNARRSVVQELEKDTKPLRVFSPQASQLRAVLRALRCHQWSKNVLVFLPVIAGHAYFNGRAVGSAFAMFIAWCLVASGIYVGNDLLDLEADRRHPAKRRRPFASGALPLPLGVGMVPVLLLLGLSIGAFISPAALTALLVYSIFAFAYSFHLKKRPLVDVFGLAFMFTIRVVGGGIASGNPVSMWLLAFTSFLFLGLAFLKRCSELVRIQALGRRYLGSRGYGVVDLPVLQMFGVASAFIAIMVLALYLNSAVAEANYRWPAALWAVAPCLLLWLCRLWLATARGEMHDDPIVYSTRDWVSWLVGGCVMATFIVATTGRPAWP